MHATARSRLFANELPSGRGRLAVAGAGIFLLVGAVQALYGPVLPSVRTAYALGVASSGWVIGTHYLGAVSGVLLTLLLGRQTTVRTRLVCGLVPVAGGAALFAGLHSWPWSLLGVVAIGVGYGILVVVVNSLFASSFGTAAAPMLVLVNAAFGLGAVIGPLLYGLLSSGSFRPAFAAAACLAALLVPLVWGVKGGAGSAAPSRDEPDEPLPRYRGAYAAFIAVFLLYTAVESDTSGWMATHLIRHGFSAGAAATLTSAFWVAFTLGRILSVPLSMRTTPLRMATTGLAAVVLLAAAALIGLPLPVVYVAIGLCLAPVFPVTFAWMQHALREARGTAPMALLGALTGGLVFPALVGALIGRTSADVLPVTLGGLALMGTVTVASIPRLLRGAETRQTPREHCRAV